jgi:hypothetical protein
MYIHVYYTQQKYHLNPSFSRLSIYGIVIINYQLVPI